jgi:hypothetical protein
MNKREYIYLSFEKSELNVTKQNKMKHILRLCQDSDLKYVTIHSQQSGEDGSQLGCSGRSLSIHPDDGGSKHIRNVGTLLPDYTAPTTHKTVTFIFAAMRT